MSITPKTPGTPKDANTWNAPRAHLYRVCQIEFNARKTKPIYDSGLVRFESPDCKSPLATHIPAKNVFCEDL